MVKEPRTTSGQTELPRAAAMPTVVARIDQLASAADRFTDCLPYRSERGWLGADPCCQQQGLDVLAFLTDAIRPRRFVLARRDHSGASFELAARATASIVIAHTAAP